MSDFNCFNRSLCRTPKCCSSSIISKPRFLNFTEFARTACVPITISAWPSVSSFLVRSFSFKLSNLLNPRTSTGNPLNLSSKLLLCCRASSVVGAINATWKPDIAATKAARIAISVLPNPTSPQINRSIGLPDPRSLITSLTATNWSSVSSYGNLAAKASHMPLTGSHI